MNEINNKETIFKGIMLAIMAAVLWGVSGIMGQFLFQYRGFNASELITSRMLFAGVILLVMSIARKQPDVWEVWKSRKDVLSLFIFSILGMLAVQYTYFAAVQYSNAATATILQYAGPVIIAIYLAFRYRKLPRAIDFFAIILAILGTFLLVTHGKMGALAISQKALWMGLGSAVALAVYTLLPMQLLQKYTAVSIIGWSMLIGGVVMASFNPPWKIGGVWDIYSLMAFIVILIFGTLIAFYAYLTAVKIIGGQKASLLASAEPLSAALMAVVFLGTPFMLMDWVGTCCILSTVFLLSYKGKAAQKQSS